MCDGGVCDVFVLEYDCLRHFLSVGLLESADVCTVVVRGGLEVPAVDGVIVPGGTCVGILTYEYRTSHWKKGHYVLVEGSEHCRIGRYSWCCI